VPLGGGYLELLAVVDPDAAPASDLSRALSTRRADVAAGVRAVGIGHRELRTA
jgi:hypothetical protein